MPQEPKSPAPWENVDMPQAEYEAVLERVQTRWRYTKQRYESILKEENEDMRSLVFGPMSERDRQAREAAGRPCVHFDEISQYQNQVINEAKANKLALKFSPSGDGADDDTAQFYAGHVRAIEYRSNASDHYVQALKDCVQRGRGCVRVLTKWVGDEFDQEFWIDSLKNPGQSFPDPDAQERTSSDAKYWFIVEQTTIQDFKRDYPFATIQEFASEQKMFQDWLFGQDRMQIAEYWEKTETPRKKLAVKRGGKVLSVWKDEYKARKGDQIARERDVPQVKVCSYITNGLELLKRTVDAGTHIPLATCIARVEYVEVSEGAGADKIILSMTRFMRGPQLAFDYGSMCELETIGMTTKNPVWAYEGQLSAAQLNEISKSMHEPVAALLAKPFIEGMSRAGSPLPLPQRNPQVVALDGIARWKEEARRSIQAAGAMGFLPAAAQQRSEKSGKALERIKQAGQVGSFHYIDAYRAMICQVGVIIEDKLDKILDTTREVDVMEEDGTPGKQWINDEQGQYEDSLPSVKGRHAVTISTGPDFLSEREESIDLADGLLANEPILQMAGPQKGPKILAKTIRLRGGGNPVVNQIADILDPPEQENGAPADPQQLMMALQQGKQVITAAQQRIAELTQEVQNKTQVEAAKQQGENMRAAMKAKTDMLIAQIEQGKDVTIAEMERATTLTVETMKDQTARLELVSEKREGELDRVQEAKVLAHASKEAQIARRDAAVLEGAGAMRDAGLAGAQAEQQADLDEQAAGSQFERDLAMQPTEEATE